MDSQELPIKLYVPTPKQAQLNFCTGSVESLVKWTKQLPMANTGESARQLYSAIRELNQWQADPVLRLKMLEVLRPFIYNINLQLNKHFLLSTLSLNEKQLKIASLGQALYTHLAIGYKLVVADSISFTKSRSTISAPTLALAIHRAITDTANIVLRSAQLYNSAPEYAWLEINQLYLLSEANQMTKVEVEDVQNKYRSTTTIHDCFVRIHLLGAAKPSNLRQQDLSALYNSLELWTGLCDIEAGDAESSLFIINLHRDRQAQYRQTLRDNQKMLFRGLNTSRLIKALKLWAVNQTTQQSIVVPKQMGDTLLSHVIQAWSIHWQRAFRRIDASGELQLCVGMSATHYYCAEQRSFDRVMSTIQSKVLEVNAAANQAFTAIPTDDIWANAFDAAANSEGRSFSFDSINFIKPSTQEEEEAAKYPAYKVQIINSSPGGYSVRWQGTAPENLQAGELLGIKEKNVNHWAIGVVRRISQQEQEVLLGIELLSPKAEVGAAQLLQKTGTHSSFMRALLLPAISAIAQPATLILPSFPFRTGNKVDLQFSSISGRHQLVKRVASTNSIGQFQFRGIGANANTNNINSQDDNFDSLWQKL